MAGVFSGGVATRVRSQNARNLVAQPPALERSFQVPVNGDRFERATGSLTDIHEVTGSFTVEAWIKPTTITAIAPIISVWLDPTDRKFQFFTDAAGKLAFDYSTDGTAVVSLVSTVAAGLTVGVWSHVAITGDTGKAGFFVDGVALGSQVSTGSAIYGTATAADLQVGAASGVAYGGLVAQPRIWDVDRSGLILANKNVSLGTVTDLVLNCPYGLTDESASGNDLSLVGTAAVVTDVPF